MLLLRILILNNPNRPPIRLDIDPLRDLLPIRIRHLHALLADLLQDMRVDVFDLDGQDVAVSGQLTDLLRVDEGAIDVGVLCVDLLGGGVRSVENHHFDAERISRFAEHLAQLAAAEETDRAVHDCCVFRA